MTAESLGKIDVVLLSHDHHFDNLDNEGRKFLATAGRVLTTSVGAGRLGANSEGIENWHSVDVPTPDGRTLSITGTPARHGPAGGDRGPVTGFVLSFKDAGNNAAYISGDTVWYEGLEEVSRRFEITTAVLFMGAARVSAVGSAHLTMTAEEGIRAANAFPKAAVVPLHFAGWEHFSESRDDIQRAFTAAGLQDRLLFPDSGAVSRSRAV
jgi:L-ascorbate metabolism protein UlaG (beta-lactamase superfamily)